MVSVPSPFQSPAMGIQPAPPRHRQKSRRHSPCRSDPEEWCSASRTRTWPGYTGRWCPCRRHSSRRQWGSSRPRPRQRQTHVGIAQIARALQRGRVPQVEHGLGGVVQANGVRSIAVPVADDGDPTAVGRPVGKFDVGVPGGVAVPQVERGIGPAVEANRAGIVEPCIDASRDPEVEGVRVAVVGGES